jgi:hypothetical protein
MYKYCAVAIAAAIGCASAPGVGAADWSWDPMTDVENVLPPGVYLFQITDTGLSATLSVAGTKFFRDDQLN